MAVGVQDRSEGYNVLLARELRDALAGAPMVAQGPMGSALMGEPCGEGVPAAAWNLEEPEAVERWHRRYIEAGAQVLITNTFQASRPALDRDRIDASVATVNRSAVDCARRAAVDGVEAPFLLGSIGPCGLDWIGDEDETRIRARAAYAEQAQALLEGGVDGLLLETFTTSRHVEPALEAVKEVCCGMPYLVSFAVGRSGDLLGIDVNIEAAVLFAEQQGASAVGINCCPLETASSVASRLVDTARTPTMIRPNAGAPHRDRDGALIWDEDPGALAKQASVWADAGIALIGTCCGYSPRATWAIADALDARIRTAR